MEWLMACKKEGAPLDFAKYLHSWCRRYPNRGYGLNFLGWINSNNPQPYNSFGNGSAMRVSPIGFFFDNEIDVLNYAEFSSIVSHNHKEGVKGAQAIALAIFLARNGYSKEEIANRISSDFKYDLTQTCLYIRIHNHFDETCQVTVPQAIIAFLESENFEDAIRNAISIGGDSDTIAAMTGGIAEAFYGRINDKIVRRAIKFIPQEMLAVLKSFYSMVNLRYNY
jgi:ADP-ribosylglycohydrolase